MLCKFTAFLCGSSPQIDTVCNLVYLSKENFSINILRLIIYLITIIKITS